MSEPQPVRLCHTGAKALRGNMPPQPETQGTSALQPGHTTMLPHQVVSQQPAVTFSQAPPPLVDDETPDNTPGDVIAYDPGRIRHRRGGSSLRPSKSPPRRDPRRMDNSFHDAGRDAE